MVCWLVQELPWWRKSPGRHRLPLVRLSLSTVATLTTATLTTWLIAWRRCLNGSIVWQIVLTEHMASLARSILRHIHRATPRSIPSTFHPSRTRTILVHTLGRSPQA